MKKYVVSMAILAMMAMGASAGVGIIWRTQGWMVEHGGDLDAGPGILEDGSVIWQLIYAGADNAINKATLENAGNGWVSGDDEVWMAREIPKDGGTAADGSSWDKWLIDASPVPAYEDDWTTPGFVYQRVYQGTPAVGSWYYESELFAYDTGYVPGSGAPAETFAIGTGGGFEPNMQMVPEPATMSLLGLGALAMVLRRKFRK
ncbi:MAG: PEP-CTERM sorting domain-containing protein [Verrucomicrobiota bacterium]|jgi:hypothetical protein|nr:PEP-CTERM sorting domain-containing protein [Verrucomicrobiota bacterium]